jgi:hypothetical protein
MMKLDADRRILILKPPPAIFPAAMEVISEVNSGPLHSMPRVETQSLREISTGSMDCLRHQAGSSPKR